MMNDLIVGDLMIRRGDSAVVVAIAGKQIIVYMTWRNSRRGKLLYDYSNKSMWSGWKIYEQTDLELSVRG